LLSRTLSRHLRLCRHPSFFLGPALILGSLAARFFGPVIRFFLSL
jgi:hypothetical protein